MGNFQSLKNPFKRNKDLPSIWVLGGPCSGRSTQCRLLAEHLQLAHISPEAIIRDCLYQEESRKRETRLKRLNRKRMYTYNAIKTREKMTQDEKDFLGSHHEKYLHSTASTTSQSQLFSLRDDPDSDDDDCPFLTRELQNSLRRGKPIDPIIISILIKEQMQATTKSCNGFLIDGYPRDFEQAEQLLRRIGEPLVLLYLESPEDVLKDRIVSRAKLAQRFDDNELTIPPKFDYFRTNTQPMIDQWLAKLSVNAIDGNGEIDEVTKKCVQLIETAFGSTLKLTKKPKVEEKRKAISGISKVEGVPSPVETTK